MKKIIISLYAAVVFCIVSVLPVLASTEGASIDKKDGNYEIEVSMEGGSGKASITSPAVMVVKDGKAYAQIEWTSPNYDYMIVNEEKFSPINEEGNSVFEIPILEFDKPIDVVADTTAMSVPHEISYTLVFDSKSIADDNLSSQGSDKVLIVVIGVLIVCVVGLLIKKKKKDR